MDNLIFLKLGGSLITDKNQPRTPRLDVLDSLCHQIADVRARDPNLLLLIGHGAGSFGHVAAKKYATREGLSPSSLDGNKSKYWLGFSEVWHEANALNKIVMAAFRAANIPAMAISPSSSVIARDGEVSAWDTSSIKYALSKGIMPIVYGDVVFDEVRGGTILSTEDLFMHLAREMRPQRILLARLEDGIYADFPARKHRVESVTPASYQKIRVSIGASGGTDVTGGMQSKVQQMLALVESIPELSVQIFSGEDEGSLEDALSGKNLGTIIKAN
mgnify:CR=1 FL=1